MFRRPAERIIEQIEQKNDERRGNERIQGVGDQRQEQTDRLLSRTLTTHRETFVEKSRRNRSLNGLGKISQRDQFMIRFEEEKNDENRADLQNQRRPEQIGEAVPRNVITHGERAAGRDDRGDRAEENEA